MAIVTYRYYVKYKNMAYNAKRMKNHLFGCEVYLNDLTNAQ